MKKQPFKVTLLVTIREHSAKPFDLGDVKLVLRSKDAKTFRFLGVNTLQRPKS